MTKPGTDKLHLLRQAREDYRPALVAVDDEAVSAVAAHVQADAGKGFPDYWAPIPAHFGRDEAALYWVIDRRALAGLPERTGEHPILSPAPQSGRSGLGRAERPGP